MIYLKYRLEKHKIPPTALIALYLVENIDWIKLQVLDEFQEAFPRSDIFVSSVHTTSKDVDLAVLVYSAKPQELMSLDDHFTDDYLTSSINYANWGWRLLAHVSTAVGFYCVDRRHLEIVPVKEFANWSRRQKLLRLVKRLRSVASRLYDSLRPR